MNVMKSFKEYLIESKKTYEFKIGIAGEQPEGFADNLETALKKYDLIKLSSGKDTPIQERPLDFPQLQNMNVTYYDAEVGYPTTPQVMAEYINAACSVPRSHIMVRTLGAPQEEYQRPVKETEYTTLLTTEDMGGPSGQDSVGQNRVMELLKELETARKERGFEPATGVKNNKILEKTNGYEKDPN